MGKSTDIAVLHYQIEDEDRLRAREKLEPQRIEMREYRLNGKDRGFILASMTACIAGLAVVWDRGPYITALGTGANLDRWKWPYRPFEPSIVEALECLELPRTKSAIVNRRREKRIRLLQLQHKIGTEFKELRQWRGDMDFDPYPGVEVILRREGGGRLLGGCVWVPEYYTTGQAWSDLGLQPPEIIN